ncbi:MAG: hypothetical protein R3C56_38000 [Pirellulaceae bacterium]
MIKGKHKGELGKLVDHLVTNSQRLTDQRYKVILLSPPDLPDTLKLDAPIPNDKRSKSGKPTAFTMGQRYVSSKALISVTTTSELD